MYLVTRAIFFIRDPISRFYSGVYLAKMIERLGKEWTEQARKGAFLEFPDANDLAENIFISSALEVSAASAMQSIRHVSYKFNCWFPNLKEVFEQRL